MKTSNKVLLFFGLVAAYALTVILPVLAWLNELEFVDVLRTVSLVIMIFDAVLFLAASVLSVATKAKLKKKINIKELMESFDNTYEFARKAEKEYFKRMGTIYKLSRVYIAFVIIMFYLGAVAAFLFHAGFAVLSILYFSAAFYSFCFFVRKQKTNNDMKPLEKSKHKYLYGMVSDCAKLLGAGENNFIIYIVGDDNASVSFYNKATHITIGFNLIMHFSEDELKNVLLHEMAHVKHDDTKRSGKYFRLSSALGSIFTEKLFIPLERPLFYWIMAKYQYHFELFSFASSLTLETAADDEVKAKGSAESYINAGAKLVCLQEYNATCSGIPVYEPEKPMENYTERVRADFLCEYEKKKEGWFSVCRNIMPMRRPTHPTFPERMEKFGITEFTTDFSDMFDCPYKEEKKEILAEVDKMFLESISKDYIKAREINYTPYKKTAELFENPPFDLPAETETFRLLKTAIAYEHLCRYDDACGLYEKVLLAEPDNALASYRKGVFMLMSYDDAGIEVVMRAVEVRSDYIERGTEVVMEYIYRRGLRDRRDATREWGLKLLQNKIDLTHNYYNYKKSDKYEKCSAPPEIFKNIADIAARDKCTSKLLAIDKISKDGYRMHAVGIFFAGTSFTAECENMYNDISFYVSTLKSGDKFFVIILNGNELFNSIFLSTKDSNIYTQKKEQPSEKN